MASIFIMKVPEFVALADAARRSGATVADLGDYLHVSVPAGRLSIQRLGGIRAAIWFAALTGGYTGAITRFDAEELWLDDANTPPAPS